MGLTPLKEIIKLKPRPETTFSLEKALKEGAKTVESYRFTPSIRDYFSEILERAASGRGQGYWIEAEYGAGKTHLLGTLGVLLTDHKGAAWEMVTDPEVKSFKSIAKTRLFPIILNCKGRLATEGGDTSLQRILEQAIEESLDRAQLRGKVTISTSDEILNWWSHASQGVRNDLTQKVQRAYSGNPSPEDLLNKKGADAFSKAIIQAARELNIGIPFNRDIRTRFNHIYCQLTKDHGYDGMVLVIDEFKSWQDLHPAGSPGFAEDEHVLETLAFHLPVDDHARIITIVASQSAPPGKLGGGAAGDRFRTFTLFASEQSEREYDEIVAFRVREILPDRVPEVDQYYNHYFKNFKFLSQSKTKKEYFREVFPFQPRCFEVIRNITKHELATARSSIHYIHEVLSDESAMARSGLIKVADLLNSKNLITDLQTAVYKEAYSSYQSALQTLPQMFEEESDRQLAEEVLKTLFLWYCAVPDSPRGLTALELAEACLATDETLNNEDLIHAIILQRLKELNQVEYTNKERGAFFRISSVSGPTYTQILATQQKKVSDDNEAAPEWLRLFMAATRETEGIPMLFAGQTFEKSEKATGRANKIRYDGERTLVERWSKSWGGPVVDKTNYSQNFRLVYLREPVDVSPGDLSDERIAVIMPASWREIAREEMRRYCAILRVEKEFAKQQGPEAEEIRQTNKIKKGEILTEIRRKQAEAYRKGRIITKAGLGIDPVQAFASPDKADEFIASELLKYSYRQPPFDSDAFRREMTAAEPGRIFGALFQGSNASADKGAVENFGLGLGLTSKRKPLEFDPANARFFEIIRNELEQAGELKLYSFYEKYTGAPYGVPVDLLSLYLIAFVRYSRPQCYVTIKPEASFTLTSGRAPRDNRIGYTDVPNILWAKSRLHRSFDRLVAESGPGWNDYIEYFRELDETLIATESPEEVIAQQERLRVAQGRWTKEISGIQTRLESLAQKLGQNLAVQLRILEDARAVFNFDVHHPQLFKEMLTDRFDNDQQKYKDTFAALRQIAELDRNHLQAISDAVVYLEQIEGLAKGSPLAIERDGVRAMFSLGAFCEDPRQAESALESFRLFRDEYATAYQKHYRDYRNEMAALHNQLQELSPVLQGLENLNGVEYLGKVVEPWLVRRREELLRRTDTSHLQSGIPDVEKRAMVNNVRLDTIAPAGEVSRFKSELEIALYRMLDLLSPPPIIGVLAASDDAQVKAIATAVDASDAEQAASLFTAEATAKVKELLRQAKMVVVEIALADYGPVHIGKSDDLPKAVQQFEQFLRQRFNKAQKENPGKIVQLNFK